jgi:hypothetical protein
LLLISYNKGRVCGTRSWSESFLFIRSRPPSPKVAEDLLHHVRAASDAGSNKEVIVVGLRAMPLIDGADEVADLIVTEHNMGLR